MKRSKSRRYDDERYYKSSGKKHRLFKTRTWIGLMAGFGLLCLFVGAIMAQPGDTTLEDHGEWMCRPTAESMIKNAIVDLFEDMITKLRNSIMKVVPYELQI